MRALRFHSKKDLRVDEIPTPKCEPDEVRLKVSYCGICGTDLHEYLEGPIMLPHDGERNALTGATLPVILGHEMSATILEFGKDVSGLHVDQRVAVNPCMDDRHHGQQACEFCVKGRHNICARVTFYGINALGGGFADEIVVKAFAVVPIPDTVPLKLAALAEPLSVAAHMVRISGFQQGQDALVLGAGPIGTAITFMLKDSGARKILVSEVAASRAAQAKKCGADQVVNPASENVVEAVHAMMGSGADVTFDACGLQVTLDTALTCTKAGGTIFNVAIHEKPLQLDLNRLTLPEKKLLAGNAYTAQDWQRVIHLMSTRGKDLEQFITAVVPLEKAVSGGFEELVTNKAMHNKILIEIDGASA